MFTAEDIQQLSDKKIDMEVVERQLTYFRDGFPFLRLERPATVGDGIRLLTDEEVDKLGMTYYRKLGRRKACKFVPASGAATRMFKDLYEYLQSDDETGSDAVNELFDRLQDFAFYPDLKKIMKNQQIAASDRKKIAAAILLPEGLNYGNLPKAMLLFHIYRGDGLRTTAMEDHLTEGARYAANLDGTVNLHFTVSPEHQQEFEALVKRKKRIYAEIFNVRYRVSFSQQKPSTDILAVDRNNQPVRDADGRILFRPGGHGALLENLNDIDADIIFIKNVDNVAPDRLKFVMVRYKMALAGLLLELHQQTAIFYRQLRKSKNNKALITKILIFLQERLSFQLPDDISSWEADAVKTYLLKILYRPIRVCGMVRNEAEPGGGPFWVRNNDGSASLQIAESPQIDMNDPQQKAIALSATHFNPVDLVCAVKDGEGNHFNLLDYRDPDTGFISIKSKDGTELKAQELPGLWNGAMAHWNTVFVEVPIETFNPVKTVNDLLRPQHQSSVN